MRCPYCDNEDTSVLDSRPGDGGESVRRRRACQRCDGRFTTFERVAPRLPAVIKSSGARERFDEDKLRRGMMRALEKRPIDSDAVEAAISRMMREFARADAREIAAGDIGEAVMRELISLDEVAYVRFASVYRRFQDIDAFSDEVEKFKESLPSRPSEEQRSLFNLGKEGERNG
ncbi:MAG: transcriptional regulator NrdR [bacterium]